MEITGGKILSFSIEHSPRQAAGNVHRKDESLFSVRSLTPPQATGNALTIAVQIAYFVSTPAVRTGKIKPGDSQSQDN
jgi:hypothetical protein